MEWDMRCDGMGFLSPLDGGMGKMKRLRGYPSIFIFCRTDGPLLRSERTKLSGSEKRVGWALDFRWRASKAPVFDGE
jgi:hypothetical protein